MKEDELEVWIQSVELFRCWNGVLRVREGGEKGVWYNLVNAKGYIEKHTGRALDRGLVKRMLLSKIGRMRPNVVCYEEEFERNRYRIRELLRAQLILEMDECTRLFAAYLKMDEEFVV